MQLANLEFRFAEYEQFWIEGESNQYKLHVDGYSGTAGRYNGASQVRPPLGLPKCGLNSEVVLSPSLIC